MIEYDVVFTGIYALNFWGIFCTFTKQHLTGQQTHTDVWHSLFARF